jgi:hypothetical protein
VMLVVTHFNKAAKILDAMNRVTDSHSLPALCRHVFCTLDSEEGKKFAPAKNNLVRDDRKYGFCYRSEEKVVQRVPRIVAPRVVWGKQVYQTANEILKTNDGGRPTDERERATEIIKKMVKGPTEAKKVYEAGEKMNISPSTILRAAKELGIVIDPARGQRGSIWSPTRQPPPHT